MQGGTPPGTYPSPLWQMAWAMFAFLAGQSQGVGHLPGGGGYGLPDFLVHMRPWAAIDEGI
jgi:hypothetical protein